MNLYFKVGYELYVWVELLVFWELLAFGGTIEPYPKAIVPSYIFFSAICKAPFSQSKLILTQ